MIHLMATKVTNNIENTKFSVHFFPFHLFFQRKIGYHPSLINDRISPSRDHLSPKVISRIWISDKK